jgi:hypothetical protein
MLRAEPMRARLDESPSRAPDAAFVFLLASPCVGTMAMTLVLHVRLWGR